MTTSVYRTLVRGSLRQTSALTTGGSLARAGGADLQCARDGASRLTLTGSGLAGALIQSAARVFPGLFDPASRKAQRVWPRITGKSTAGPADRLLQSLWHVAPAHLQGVTVELRQGVGIRQATGATASEAVALFDMETVPPGSAWEFFLEIDSLRGGPEVEAVALYALTEWCEGRCWLGAGAARGLGWMRLENVRVLRLPLTPGAVDVWPDARHSPDEAWAELARLPGAQQLAGTAQVREAAEQLGGRLLPEDRFAFVDVTGLVEAGERADGYGLDALAVGGHAAGALAAVADDRLRTPDGADPESYRVAYDSDAPVVTSDVGAGRSQPIIPGGGLRGPLRHAASRRWRGEPGGTEVVDPNERKEGEGGPPAEYDDRVSRLFGLTGQCGRLLLSDALPEGDCLLACLQHHAEDEFTGGVFGHSKFDRTAVLRGAFAFRLVVEARSLDELGPQLETLASAVALAELGLAPLGGAKTRGAGGRWRFREVYFGKAGEALRRFPEVAGKFLKPNELGVLLRTIPGLMRGEGR